jgi:hypothetical protein
VMNLPADPEVGLRADLAEMAEAVTARPEITAAGAESRAAHVVRRHRTWAAVGAAGVLVAAAVAVPTWLLGKEGSAAPAGRPERPLTSPAATCQTLVDAPNSHYTRVLAASATTGAGLAEQIGPPGVGGDSRQREAAAMHPASRYVVCGLLDPHVAVSGPPGGPSYDGTWAVIVIVPSSGPIFSTETSTPSEIRLKVDAFSPAGAEQRCSALVDAPRSAYSRLLIWRAVTGAQLRHWLRTREGGVYSQDVVRRYDPDLRYAVCGLVEPGAAPPGPVPPKGVQAVVLVLPPSGPPVLDTMGPRAGIVDSVALLP